MIDAILNRPPRFLWRVTARVGANVGIIG